MLRDPVKTDFEVLAALRNDSSVQRQLMIESKQYNTDQIRAWIRRRTRDLKGMFFVIESNGPCGFVQLTQIDLKTGSGDLGICLINSARGKGIAKIAMRQLEKRAMEKYRCKKFTLRVLRINHRAISFYKKLKYKIIEIKRRHHFDGLRWRDVIFMEKRLR
ncbi:MAG TPA: hypothetical protein DEB48_02970 [Verrucomicrobiales bacterium]|nr:hypothetical protein [Verrucomicrobiales bacterium]|tara:strand:- start:423 stop:905 length:483 start_codon:yes stop_codon:yes gene_type:complete